MIMSDHAVMPYQHYKDACDAIRAKGAGSSSIKSGDMAAAINSISSGSSTLPDISFTHIHGCPPFGKNGNDYFGNDIRSYLTDCLNQPGDLLLTFICYIGLVDYGLNIPSVAKGRNKSTNGNVTTLYALSTKTMVQLLTSEPANDFDAHGELFFARIRGCQLYQSFTGASLSIESNGSTRLTSGASDALRTASFGFAVSATATDMLTCSANVADNDVLKHSFTTTEFDSQDKHIRCAFFSAVKQRTTPGNDVMRLTITNPGSGAYNCVQTGVFYS